MASAKKTQDHDTIKQWIQKHQGRPAVVSATHNTDEGDGILRVKFNDNEENLEEVEWEEFFDIFDENALTFLYQDEEKGESRFFKFVND